MFELKVGLNGAFMSTVHQQDKTMVCVFLTNHLCYVIHEFKFSNSVLFMPRFFRLGFIFKYMPICCTSVIKPSIFLYMHTNLCFSDM